MAKTSFYFDTHVGNFFDPPVHQHHRIPVLQGFLGNTSEHQIFFFLRDSSQLYVAIETCFSAIQINFSGGEEEKVFLKAHLIHLMFQKYLKTPWKK